MSRLIDYREYLFPSSLHWTCEQVDRIPKMCAFPVHLMCVFSLHDNVLQKKIWLHTNDRVLTQMGALMNSFCNSHAF